MPGKVLRVDRPFDVYLESNRVGRTVAHVAQLPGCIVRASTSDVAVANVKTAIQQYVIWLAAHSDSELRTLSTIQINIAGRCPGGAASGSGSRVALLNADLVPMSKSELSAANALQAIGTCARNCIYPSVNAGRLFEWEGQD